MKILVVILFIISILLISHKQFNVKEINVMLLGESSQFSNIIESVNYSDLISYNLKDKDLLGFYSKDFIYKDIRIVDLMNKIDKNELKDDLVIQNIINKSDIILLNIGESEINYKLKNEKNKKNIMLFLDEKVKEVTQIIEKINKLSDAKIIFIGYYNDTNIKGNNKYYKYINNKLTKKLKNITYIDLYKILNNNYDYYEINDYSYISKEGNVAIYNQIMRKIDNFDLPK